MCIRDRSKVWPNLHSQNKVFLFRFLKYLLAKITRANRINIWNRVGSVKFCVNIVDDKMLMYMLFLYTGIRLDICDNIRFCDWWFNIGCDGLSRKILPRKDSPRDTLKVKARYIFLRSRNALMMLIFVVITSLLTVLNLHTLCK